MTRVALILAVDAGYLPGFAPLVASLERASPIIGGLDRIVLTTDPAIAEDPDLRRRAARVRLVGPADLAPFASVQRARIPEAMQRPDLPKGSMLKWFAYDDYGYDAALVLDADMICLRNADRLLRMLGRADVIGAPIFPPALRRARGKPLPHPVAARNIAQFAAGRGDWTRKLNSGMVLFNRKLMGPQVRGELIAIASAKALTNEQLALRRWIRRRRDVRLRLVAPAYNFHANFLATAEPEGAGKLARKVRFLHYVGPKKPWSVDDAARHWAHDLWRDLGRDLGPPPDREAADAPGDGRR